MYKSVVPKSYYTGGKESIDVWLRSRHWDEANHLRMVQNAAKGVGVNINTVDELANILRGPQYYKSYKRFRLNGSEFCSTAWEVRDRGTRSTTRRVIKYRLKDNSKREFDFGFGYAMIEGIYEFRSHSLLESSKVYQLLRIHNFSRKMVTPTRYETHPSQLTRVARASKSNNVHYHSAVIPINDVSAFNVALWPDGDTANYFIVHVHVDPDTIPGRAAPVEENDANNQPNDDMEEEFDELDEEHADDEEEDEEEEEADKSVNGKDEAEVEVEVRRDDDEEVSSADEIDDDDNDDEEEEEEEGEEEEDGADNGEEERKYNDESEDEFEQQARWNVRNGTGSSSSSNSSTSSRRG